MQTGLNQKTITSVQVGIITEKQHSKLCCAVLPWEVVSPAIAVEHMAPHAGRAVSMSHDLIRRGTCLKPCRSHTKQENTCTRNTLNPALIQPLQAQAARSCADLCVNTWVRWY